MNKNRIASLLISASLLVIGTTFAGTLSFQTSGNIIKNCPTQIDIIIDTQDKEINTAWINIFLNDSFIINEYSAQWGVFRAYPGPKTHKASEEGFKEKEFIRFIGTSSSKEWFKGEGKFSTITITPTSDILDLEFYMIPEFEGEDSDLAYITEDWQVKDALTAVENKIIQTKKGECIIGKLEELKIEKDTNTITTIELLNIVEKDTEILEENIFDTSQETNRLKRNKINLIVAIWLLLIIITILTTRKKKKQ